ncbi:MAG: methyltransferase domain-containing protein [Pseudoxanthomonas sp.]|nr:methyltransferase domain-containing protein [Pseudoxanthomonas sp.]
MMITRDFNPTAFARQLRASCGFGRYLYLGEAPDGVVNAMRRELLDAYDEHADKGAPLDGVILDVRQDGAKTLSRLGEIAHRHARCLVVVAEFAGAPDSAARDREALEKAIISAGYRKTAAYYDFNPFESLNAGSGLHVAPFERVPTEALARFNLEVLEEERLLHTDMAREAGRRSDAHCVRYHRAAEYIRPGDRVLDVACGLGYGSRILFDASAAESVHGVDLSDFGIDYAKAHYQVDERVTFAVGDAEKLEHVPDASIDFIAAFETIEHVPHPEEYLRQLKRVLKPGGRVMVCAPNDWTDETGRDPNPHHLHVYTWERLKGEIERHFLIEKAFIQVAGGAMKCHFSPRSWREVDPDRPEYGEAEWIVFLGMKDPLDTEGARFEETSWVIPRSSRFHVSAFARDYLNPWVVRAMVAIGMRVQNAGLLDRFRRQVLDTAPKGSVDHGAALCGTLYGLIERNDFGGLELIRSQVDGYLGNRRPSPHQRRWQVSISYVAGLLAHLGGDARLAMAYLDACIGIDPVPYSPILGNKTLDALYLKAVLLVSGGDVQGARALLQESVALPQRWTSSSMHNRWHRSWLNIIGLEQEPLPFGLAEMAMLFDKASRAAYMLSLIDTVRQRPAAFAREAEGFLERQLGNLRAELAEQREAGRAKIEEIVTLNKNARDLVAHSEALAARLVESERRIHELASEVVEQSEKAQSLGARLTDLDAQFSALCETAAADISQRDSRIAELAHEVITQSERAQLLGGEVAERDRITQELARQVTALDEHSQNLARSLSAEIESRDRLIAELERKIVGES